MKGIFFQKPLEFQLLVDGESWNQGDPIQGTLVIKNHGAEALPLDTVRVHLAHGELRKVRLKSPDAFDIVTTAPIEQSGSIAPGQEARVSWQFQTEPNSPITDVSKSLYLLYGRGEATESLGQIQLMVHPAPLIQEFLKTLTIQFRFVVKTQKFTKRGVEIKLAPPTAKAFATLEHLMVSFNFEEEETLRIHYTFHVKRMEAGPVKTETIKEKREAEQELPPTQYRLASGRWNYEAMEALIAEALALVESKTVF